MQRLNDLEQQIAQHEALEEERESDPFVALLKDVTVVARDADANAAPDLPDVVNKAGSILDSAIDWAYGDGDFDFLPSYAHTDELPPVQDTLRTIGTTAFRHSDVGNDVALMHMILVFQWVSELRRNC